MARPLIMVLNHDMPYLEMMCDCLSYEGYDAISYHESQKTFEIIKERLPQLVIIELLITDPESGLMVLNKMRLDPETAHIPVIIASTLSQLIRDNEEHLRSKGCDMLVKPFDLEELLTIVGKWVQAPDYAHRPAMGELVSARADAGQL